MNRKVNDCIPRSLAHAGLLLDLSGFYPLVNNSFPDITLPYAYIPQLGAAYNLYITEVPRTLPISLLQPDAVFIIVYTTKTHDLHAIVAHNHHFYDPQHQCDVPTSDLMGHIVAIYHCQRALSLADIHNELASLS